MFSNWKWQWNRIDLNHRKIERFWVFPFAQVLSISTSLLFQSFSREDGFPSKPGVEHLDCFWRHRMLPSSSSNNLINVDDDDDDNYDDVGDVDVDDLSKPKCCFWNIWHPLLSTILRSLSKFLIGISNGGEMNKLFNSTIRFTLTTLLKTFGSKPLLWCQQPCFSLFRWKFFKSKLRS